MAKNLSFQLQAELQAVKYVAHTQMLEIQTLKQQLASVSDENKALKVEMSQGATILENAAQQVDFLQRENQRLSSIAGNTEQVCSLQTKLNQTQQETINYQSQIMQLKQQIQKQSQVVQHLQQRFVTQDIENSGLSQQLDSLRQNFAIVSEQRDSFQAMNKQLQQQIFDLQQQQLQEQIQQQSLVNTTIQVGGQVSQTLRQSHAERELRDARQQLQEEQLISRQLKLDNEQMQLRFDQMKQDLSEMRQRAQQELQRMKQGYQQRFNDASLEYSRLQQENRVLWDENQQLKHTLNILQMNYAHGLPQSQYRYEQQNKEYAEEEDEPTEQVNELAFHTPDEQTSRQELRLSPKDLLRDNTHQQRSELPLKKNIPTEPMTMIQQRKLPEPVQEVVQRSDIETHTHQLSQGVEDMQSHGETSSEGDMFKSKSMLDSLCQYQQRTHGPDEDDDLEVAQEATVTHQHILEEQSMPVIEVQGVQRPQQTFQKSPTKQHSVTELGDQTEHSDEAHGEMKQEEASEEQYVYLEESEEEQPAAIAEPVQQSPVSPEQISAERAATLDAIQAKADEYSKKMREMTVFSDKPEISLEGSASNGFYSSHAVQGDQSTLSELRERYDPNGIQALSQFHQQRKQEAVQEDENMSISDLKMDTREVIDDLGLDDEFEPTLPPEKAEEAAKIRELLAECQDSLREFDAGDLAEFQSRVSVSGPNQ